jgi:hypothetical protein
VTGSHYNRASIVSRPYSIWHFEFTIERVLPGAMCHFVGDGHLPAGRSHFRKDSPRFRGAVCPLEPTSDVLIGEFLWPFMSHMVRFRG